MKFTFKKFGGGGNRKEPTLLFICSTLTTDVQNILETSEPRPTQNRRPEPRKHTQDPHFDYIGVFIISAIAGILLKSQDVYFFSVQFFARY